MRLLWLCSDDLPHYIDPEIVRVGFNGLAQHHKGRGFQNLCEPSHSDSIFLFVILCSCICAADAVSHHPCAGGDFRGAIAK